MLPEGMQHTELNPATASLDSICPTGCLEGRSSFSPLLADESLLAIGCSFKSQPEKNPADDYVASAEWDCRVPLSLQPAMEEISLQVFLESTGHVGGNLNQQASNINKAVHKSSSSSVLFTSSPLAAMASKWVFQAIFIAISIINACFLASLLHVVAHNGNFPVGLIRLRVLEIKGGITPAVTAFKFSAAGLLQNGCKLFHSADISAGLPVILPVQPHNFDSGISSGNSNFTILGADPANGYFFVTNGTDMELYPVRWVAESSQDNGRTWLPVGASVWRLDSEGRPDLHPELAYIIPGSKSEFFSEVQVDARPSLSWLLASVVDKVIYMLGFFSFALGGLVGHADWMRPMCIVVLSSDIMNTASRIAAIFISEPWMWREGVKRIAYLPLMSMFVIGCAFFERHFISVLVVYSLSALLSICSAETLLYRREFFRVLSEQITSMTFVGMVFGVGAICFRHRVLSLAHRLIIVDYRRYNAVWDAFRADSASESALLAVHEEAFLTLAESNEKMDIPRQYQHFPTEASESVLSWWCTSWSRDLADNTVQHPFKQVKSLDQLFVQALCLNPILQNKVQAWALASRGCFPCKQPEHHDDSSTVFIRYADVAKISESEAAAIQDNLKWPNVKSKLRTTEKLARSYGQDVSRLVDLCRQNIVFCDTQDIATCLHTIRMDPDILVVRIKNRLDISYNASMSAGYRDVMINLRISNELTKALGVDRHLCEVQLIPLLFAELKNNEGHQRYITFRNLLGE
eukprot:CAMPEP_0172185550 /NCGR_PEP_ID=MMETSP1050-20130122/20237_1 /TAXON_ID=233186 /ORGANISM="Cryptomonas curvata, Strain CCAP979/52" /LENGTH=748 /DNA_ID=CAMNT_0012859559 /DNA_START=169 /DNA_END=2415 /DNA_ORIENTATION=-